jgi:hypothetical protein
MRVRQSSRPRQMDDRVRLQASVARRRELELIAMQLPSTREPQAHRARDKAYQAERSDDNPPAPRPELTGPRRCASIAAPHSRRARDRVPTARRSVLLARGIVTRRVETLGSVSAASKARPAKPDAHYLPVNDGMGFSLNLIGRNSKYRKSSSTENVHSS